MLVVDTASKNIKAISQEKGRHDVIMGKASSRFAAVNLSGG
jgi:hypothetical protein